MLKSMHSVPDRSKIDTSLNHYSGGCCASGGGEDLLLQAFKLV
jgi:hypothetical protein